MTKAYLVTDGSYSDYRVLGVYSTAEKAAHAKKLYAADNEFVEIEIDALPDSPPGLFYYLVAMDVEGNASEVSMMSADPEFRSKYDWHPLRTGESK